MDEEDRDVMRKAFRKEKMFDGRQWVFCFREDDKFWVNFKGNDIVRTDN